MPQEKQDFGGWGETSRTRPHPSWTAPDSPGHELPFPWVRVHGMENSGPGFDRQPAVINGFSDLILEPYGPERGAHARSAVGMAGLPMGIPVEIEAEVEIAVPEI